MFKKKGALIGAIALTLVLGCGFIFGNAALASWIMGTESEPASGVQSVILSVDTETPWQGSIELETPNAGRVSTGMITLENGHTILIEYFFDESERVVKANVTLDGDSPLSYEGGDAEQALMRLIGTDEYDSWANQVSARTSADGAAQDRTRDPIYIYGDPSDSKITQQEAIDNAEKFLMEKYALKPETMGRFTVTPKFYTRYEDIFESVWWVNYYPTITEEFMEIGCYWALINSDTGDAVGLFSAADGKG